MDNDCVTTKRLIFNRNGQGQVEYTLIVLLVTFVFWLGIRDTDVGPGLQTAWTSVGGSIGPTTDNGAGPSSGSGAASGTDGSGNGSGGTAGGGSSGTTAGNSVGAFGGSTSGGD